MANELQKFYGIKEVADVSFYLVNDDGDNPPGENGYPDVLIDNYGRVCNEVDMTEVLRLETLKVSNIEFTAEQTEARGGKGNAPLIVWDYGREINISIEDALMSMEMLHLLNGVDTSKLDHGEELGNTIEISPNTFPGTYMVIGKTFARDTDGKDRYFTFVVPKAKIQSETTLTMEADGDPTVFNMTLRVLRNGDQPMMKLILDEESTVTTDNTYAHWNFPISGSPLDYTTWRFNDELSIPANTYREYSCNFVYMGKQYTVLSYGDEYTGGDRPSDAV